MLDRQINLFKVDTDCFLYPDEQALADKKMQYRQELFDLKSYKKDSKYYGLSKKERDNIKKELEQKVKESEKEYKTYLKKSAQEHLKYNETHKKKHIRQLNRNRLYYLDKQGDEQVNLRKVVSMFESTLSRSMGVRKDELTFDIFILEIYYYDVAKDLILNGFDYNGKHYIYFSSSAGQIRTKKAVFVNEEKYKLCEDKITCGLTVDHINELGGMNVNKLLAYKALSNSATDLWEDVLGIKFDIDRCIVVDDFETMVRGKMDNINYQTYEITRGIEQEVPIPHTDGCGMIRSDISSKNFMIRMPWCKGLLGSFPFDKFCKENNCTKVKDIWGKEYDIIDDNIQVILTKSVFKMNKYFLNWDEYKDCFKKYNCEIGICNIEEDDIPDAQINYQMLQTLHDMTDKEIKELCEPANNKIKELSSSLKNALEFYRVKVNRDNKFEPFDKNNWFEKGLSIYPELIKDPATQQDLKDKKNSLVKRYRAGKLDVRGKFTFVLPDLYAFCEWLFLGIEKPEGLIEDGEVYCRLYPTVKELDCLRSPHLYIEHAVRNNIYGKRRREENLDDWFGNTDAIYISTKDLISRILMMDCDGDRLLVLSDNFIVNIAKRNSKEVYPLYYELHKANIEKITSESIYNGLEAAFKGGKIGAISNDITKIWAEKEITNQEKDCIKLLVFENNAVIDMAKTLWKPERPKKVNKLIKTYTHKKVPYFFRYAKNKIFSKNYKKSQTEKCGNGVIDRITKTIKDKRIIFSNIKNLNDIDYRYMLSDYNNDYTNEKVNKLFNHHNRYYGYNIRYDDKDKDDNNINYICQVIRSELNEIEPDENKIVDSLVTMMYKKPSTKKKNLLWILYGETICNNLKKNLGNSKICIQCGRRVDYNLTLGKCKSCRPDANRRQLENKEIVCSDCGKKILIPSSSRRIRCDSCMAERRKETYKKSKQNKNSTSYST